MARLEQILTAAAREQGFALVGFAPLRRLDEREEFFTDGWPRGARARWDGSRREPERRLTRARIDPRLRSVVSLAYPYIRPRPPRSSIGAPRCAGGSRPTRWGRTTMIWCSRTRRAVATRLKSERPDAITRAYVDTGAVFEREWAAEARLGWFGKNTTRSIASTARIFFSPRFSPTPNSSRAASPIASIAAPARRCLDLCPTAALAEGYVMEPRLCISYLTIEHRGPIPASCGRNSATGFSDATSARRFVRGT